MPELALSQGLRVVEDQYETRRGPLGEGPNFRSDHAEHALAEGRNGRRCLERATLADPGELVVEAIEDRREHHPRAVVVALDELEAIGTLRREMEIPRAEEADLRAPLSGDRGAARRHRLLPGGARGDAIEDADEALDRGQERARDDLRHERDREALGHVRHAGFAQRCVQAIFEDWHGRRHG